jgi:hypothetical protein
MSDATRLEPLSAERARQVMELLRRSQDDANAGLALDDQGRVLGLVGVADPGTEHMLGDLDVHA